MPVSYGKPPDLSSILLPYLDHGANVDPQQAEHGRTPLMYAAMKGNIEIARMLLTHGADPNLRNADGESALHLAAWYDRGDMADLLIAHGSDPNVTTKSAWYAPLHFAAMTNHTDVVRRLVGSRADVRKRDSRGATALHYAMWYGNRAASASLLNAGATEESDGENRTPSDWADMNHHPEMREWAKDRLITHIPTRR